MTHGSGPFVSAPSLQVLDEQQHANKGPIGPSADPRSVGLVYRMYCTVAWCLLGSGTV